MKKTIIILSALLIALGLTQCKKSEQPADNQGEGVTISLQVNPSTGSGSGSKVLVNTETGSVDYEVDDQILVASAGKYVGTLTYNGTLNEGAMFSGTIANATEGQPLQFFSLGNLTPAETLTSGITESCSVVISDQTEHLPVISAAPSFENFAGNLTEYTAIMRNKCALVKFDVNTASTAATCITGFNNKVTVSFMENSLAYSQEGEGVITLPAGSGERWAILLPQETVDNATAYSIDGAWEGTCGDIPSIETNGYLTEGIAVDITTKLLPQGVISGLFSVSETQQVYFSQGNLQYIGSAAEPYWQFAEHQWDYLGVNGQAGGNETIDRDLFGWGTSGYNHGATCYQPWHVSTDDGCFYAYGNWQKNLYDETGQADWGYNAIANGGNQENSGWRTMTAEEWYYLLITRSTTSGILFTEGTVNGVAGLIVLPDEWDNFIYALNDVNGGTYSSNIITAENWTSIFEANGAVFLTTGGEADWGGYGFMGERGYYWSSSYDYTWSAMKSLEFGPNYISVYPPGQGTHRYYAYSVRLVRNAE